ncbi:2OG-Fe(II) oxygenase [Phormidium tenue FACHB-886]|nr:2OG-Fe(II) oxygenase [Phormidium tenue FACHB-886]
MSALTIGDPAPWFIVPSLANLDAHQQTIAGGYRAVLFFFGSIRNPLVQKVLAEFHAKREQFEAQQVTVFAVGLDANERSKLEQQMPADRGFEWLFDAKGEVSIGYGVCQPAPDGSINFAPTTFVLDENLRVLSVVPLEMHLPHVDRVLQQVQRLPLSPPSSPAPAHAPVLLIPNVFPPAFCQHLIGLYEADGGTESGFMTQEDGKAVVELNASFKRRRDLLLTDATLLNQISAFIGRRVMPEVYKVFQFRITRFERYTIGCYEATQQGFFRPHRDNVNPGSAHRRFAMTLNLNTGAYEGGCLRFPEYSQALYSPGVGDAVIFSCSLVHEVTPVTQGQRFALLSFFFDDEDAKLRKQTVNQIVRRDG